MSRLLKDLPAQREAARVPTIVGSDVSTPLQVGAAMPLRNAGALPARRSALFTG
jgi:hypothetical protein